MLRTIQNLSATTVERFASSQGCLNLFEKGYHSILRYYGTKILRYCRHSSLGQQVTGM